MDPNNTSAFATGIAPDHGLALLAGLLVAPALWLALRLLRARALRGGTHALALLARYNTTPVVERAAAALLLTAGVVHLALPFGGATHHGPLLSLGFLVSGAAYVWLARRVFSARRWRGPAALLLAANVVGYLVLAGSGWHEEADQVGIATTVIELAALGLVLAPGRTGLARFAASTTVVSFTVLTGVVIWIGSFVAHNRAEAAPETHAHADHTPADHAHPVAAHSHGDFVARAQAGTLMRPLASRAPTPEEADAAAAFAVATKAGVAKYADVNAAIADGYVPDGPELGLERHYKNEAHSKDGALLDPERPELLVYATANGRSMLLGAVYTMDRAGVPGPGPGGPLTRWHAHNICVTLLPPAFGLVSPFGSCPVASVATTIPEMMHVWSIDNPGGPYAESLDDKYVRSLLAATTE